MTRVVRCWDVAAVVRPITTTEEARKRLAHTGGVIRLMLLPVRRGI